MIQELLPSVPEKREMSDGEIVDRVTLAMINEATRCLEEKVVENPGYLDVALIYGIGFPPFRGGLLRYADTLGVDAVVSRLKDFEQKFGMRYSPTKLLLQMEKEHREFYAG